jgi:hypothetical protein
MSDALATLRTALSPKGSMRRIPIPLESYQHPSPALSAKRLLNMLAEQEPADARTAAALIPVHGLRLAADVFGAGPITAMNSDQPGVMYVASGTHFFRMTQPFGGPRVIEDLGEIGIPGGADYSINLMVTIAVGVTAAVVCVPPNAFTCPHAGALNQIGGTFPGARSVAYLDGYFVFTSDDDDSNFFCSLLLDPTMFDALDFAFADGVPNVLHRVIPLAGELWLAGDTAMEVWYDAGAADFPFRRQSGGVVPYGAVSMKSIVVLDGSLFWLASNGSVLRSQGYKAVRVSTHAIESLIQAIGIFQIVSAVGYTYKGHRFYCLTFVGHTLVYDTQTNVWHERSSSADGAAAWLVSAVAQVGSDTIFGTSGSGRTFNPFDNDDDDGIQVIRHIVLPPLWGGTYLGFCHRLEIEMERGGVDPTGNVLLEWSDDDGLTWKGGRVMTAGTTSGYRGRVFTTRLGSFRARIFRLTAHHRCTVYAVEAAISGGASGAPDFAP